MKKEKIIAIVLGSFWGFLITSICYTVGHETEASICSWWDAIRLVLVFATIIFFAIETYKLLKS